MVCTLFIGMNDSTRSNMCLYQRQQCSSTTIGDQFHNIAKCRSIQPSDSAFSCIEMIVSYNCTCHAKRHAAAAGAAVPLEMVCIMRNNNSFFFLLSRCSCCVQAFTPQNEFELRLT